MATKDAQGTVGTVRWSVTDGGDTLLIEPVRGRVGRVSAHDARWDGWQRPAMRVRRIRCEGTIRVTGTLERMFCGYSRLEDVSGLGHWDVSGVTGLCEAFLDCRSLASLDGLETWDVGQVTDVLSMFLRCDALTDVSALASWRFPGLASLSHMFSHCTRLSDLTPLGGWDVSGVRSCESMFYDCVGIESLDGLGSWDTRSLRDATAMFCGCRSLSDASAVGGWDTRSLGTMNLMFDGCESLRELDLSSWDVRRLREASGAFRCCSRLRTLDLSGWDAEGLHGRCGGIFERCASLADVRLGEHAGRTLPYQAKRLARWREGWDGWYHADPASMVGPADRRLLRMSDEELWAERERECLREPGDRALAAGVPAEAS